MVAESKGKDIVTEIGPWNRVKDGIPDDEILCLVYWRNKDEVEYIAIAIFLCKYLYGFYTFEGNEIGDKLDQVTHWIKIPKTPIG